MRKIKIYWGFKGPAGSQLLVEPMVGVLKDVSVNKDTLSGIEYEEYKKCPAHIKYFKNTFVVKAFTDITLEHRVLVDGMATLSSPTHDQEGYNAHVDARIIENSDFQLVQLEWNMFMFTDKDIEVSQIPATIHVNPFLRDTIQVSGIMNISKWFRPIRPAFFIPKNGSVTIKRGDALYYIKVHSTEPLELIQFNMGEELENLANDCLLLKLHKSRASLKSLYGWFTKARYQTRVLNGIKKNLR
jgi:hypothetical protein